jgi:hypothetical protein
MLEVPDPTRPGAVSESEEDPMSLSDDVAEAEKVAKKGGTRCSACDTIQELEDIIGSRETLTPEGRAKATEDLVAIRNALSGKIAAEPLSGIFRRNGYQIGRPSIRAHRKEGHTP